jgi:hypothetical protein
MKHSRTENIINNNIFVELAIEEVERDRSECIRTCLYRNLLECITGHVISAPLHTQSRSKKGLRAPCLSLGWRPAPLVVAGGGALAAGACPI